MCPMPMHPCTHAPMHPHAPPCTPMHPCTHAPPHPCPNAPCPSSPGPLADSAFALRNVQRLRLPDRYPDEDAPLLVIRMVVVPDVGLIVRRTRHYEFAPADGSIWGDLTVSAQKVSLVTWNRCPVMSTVSFRDYCCCCCCRWNSLAHHVLMLLLIPLCRCGVRPLRSPWDPCRRREWPGWELSPPLLNADCRLPSIRDKESGIHPLLEEANVSSCLVLNRVQSKSSPKIGVQTLRIHFTFIYHARSSAYMPCTP